MKNVRNEKLNKLRTRGVRDVLLAIDWLEKNRGKFKGKIFDPMFLQVVSIIPGVTFHPKNYTRPVVVYIFLIKKGKIKKKIDEIL